MSDSTSAPTATGQTGGRVRLGREATAALEHIRAGRVHVAQPARQKAPLSAQTIRAYERWIFRWHEFCEAFGWDPLPAQPVAQAQYVHWLCQLDPARGVNRGRGFGLAPASIKQALTAVAALHLAAGRVPPDDWEARKAMADHAEVRKQADVVDNAPAPALMLPTLLDLVRACPTDSIAGVRDRAMLLGGFTLAALPSQLVALDVEHVHDDGERVRVDIPPVNTIPGRSRFLPSWPKYPGCSPDDAMRSYLDGLALVGVTHGPLFRGIDMWGHVNGASAVYAGISSNGARMLDLTVELVIARAAERAMARGADLGGVRMSATSLRNGARASAYQRTGNAPGVADIGGWNMPAVWQWVRGIDVDDLPDPMAVLGADET